MSKGASTTAGIVTASRTRRATRREFPALEHNELIVKLLQARQNRVNLLFELSFLDLTALSWWARLAAGPPACCTDMSTPFVAKGLSDHLRSLAQGHDRRALRADRVLMFLTSHERPSGIF